MQTSKESISSDRISNEISHGKLLIKKRSGKFWYWESKAGKERLERRKKMLCSLITPEMNILEVGCGPGYFTETLANTNARISAIDISPEFIQLAKKNIIKDNVKFSIENGYNLSFADNTFDQIIGSSILHHLDVPQALSEFYRILKPGGLIFFTEPNMLNPHVYLERKVGFIRKMFDVSPDETAFVRWKLKKDLIAHGFIHAKLIPFDFLHPLVPDWLVGFFKTLGDILEKVPLMKEIAGSLYITAQKPGLS